jgi:tetratricopeptide (TPR) repeat protein
MRIVSGSDDNTVRVWDAASGEMLVSLAGHEDFVKSVAFSPDGTRIVAAADDNTVRIWEAARSSDVRRRSAIADGYEQDGQDERAELLRRAVVATLRRTSSAVQRAELATALVRLGANLNRQGKYEEAERHLREAVETFRAAGAAESWRIPQATSHLAQSIAGLRRVSEARSLLLESLKDLVTAPETPLEVRCRVVDRLSALSAPRSDEGENDETHSVERWADESARRLGPGGRERMARLLLACAPEDSRYVNNALGLALDAARTVGKENLRVLETLANAYWCADEFETALEHQERAVFLLEAESRSPRTARVTSNLFLLRYAAAQSYHQDGRQEDAIRMMREGLDYHRRVLGGTHPTIFPILGMLAWVYQDQSRHEEYEDTLRELLEAERRFIGEDHPGLAGTMYDLGCLAALRGDPDEALDWLRQSVDHGWSKGDWMTRDPDLVSLHGTPEFEALVAKVKRRVGEE